MTMIESESEVYRMKMDEMVRSLWQRGGGAEKSALFAALLAGAATLPDMLASTCFTISSICAVLAIILNSFPI